MKSLLHPNDRAEVLRRLRAVRPDSRPRWGRMSAPQMICHLSDSFRAALGERAVRQVGGPFHRTIVKWGALYLPRPWPKHYPTMPEVDALIGGTPPGAYEQDLRALEALVHRFCTAGPLAHAHPIFGEMTPRQWMRWGYLHMDHHLRQFGA